MCRSMFEVNDGWRQRRYWRYMCSCRNIIIAVTITVTIIVNTDVHSYVQPNSSSPVLIIVLCLIRGQIYSCV